MCVNNKCGKVTNIDKICCLGGEKQGEWCTNQPLRTRCQSGANVCMNSLFCKNSRCSEKVAAEQDCSVDLECLNYPEMKCGKISRSESRQVCCTTNALGNCAQLPFGHICDNSMKDACMSGLCNRNNDNGRSECGSRLDAGIECNVDANCFNGKCGNVTDSHKICCINGCLLYTSPSPRD